MGRMQSQIQGFRKRFARRRSKGLMVNQEQELHRRSTPPDVASARAKSRRHGKVTAEHWNQ